MSNAVILGNGPGLTTRGWLDGLLPSTIYGVNRSYEEFDQDIWVTADELALMAGIDHFNEVGWPEKVVTTQKALQRVSEQRGVTAYRTFMQIFPGAGFSGTLAMRSAALRGYDNIYLVGFDGGDGRRFYDEPDETEPRKDFGSAYGSLMDVIVEGFPESKWWHWTGWTYKPLNKTSTIEGWVR